MKSSLALAALTTATACGALYAAPPKDSPFGAATEGLHGQVRTRTEFIKKSFADSVDPTLSTGLRSRLSYTATPSEVVSLKFELQDSRGFGSEPAAVAANPATSTIGDAKGVDLLQAYAKAMIGQAEVVLGRQKMSLGSGRFLSTLEWHPYSRAFDGVSLNSPIATGNLTAFSFLPNDPMGAESHLWLSGLYFTQPLTPDIGLDVMAFLDHADMPVPVAPTGYSLIYVGEKISGKVGPITFEEEFIYQLGTVDPDGTDLSSQAFQLGVRVGSSVGKLSGNLGFDMMSGDDDATDDATNTYRANYFFGHAFFGWMDYFLVNPPAGVMDARADVSLGLFDINGKTGKAMVQGHYFMPAAGEGDPYGIEIDAELHFGLFPKSNIVIGAAAFIPDAAPPGFANVDDAPAYFFYLMPIFNF
jgi:hypothetical protein